jgi:group I intron endonuclease
MFNREFKSQKPKNNRVVAGSSPAGRADFTKNTIFLGFESIFMFMDSNYKYTVYKTTNIINNKIYIGIHKTKNLNDGYIGSGTYLKRAIKKYGIQNFKKEILFVFNTPTEMYAKEKEIVNRLFIESENTYNIMEGGSGGFDYVNNTKQNLYKNIGDGIHGQQNLMNGGEIKKYLIEKGLWEEWKTKVSTGLKEKFQRDGHHWTGRKHKPETKEKMSKIASMRVGQSNSQYGTCWIFSDVEKISKKIKIENLIEFENRGWKKGRKLKFQ